MTPPADPGPLDRVLDQARAVEPEPPQGFVATIMRGVHDAQARMSTWRRWRRAAQGTNLLSSAGVDPASIGIVTANRRYAATGDSIMKKIVWGVAAVGAVAIVSVVWLGYPPMGSGTEGTVGGAQRYQAPPTADKSAALGDMSAQAFLQTDTFDRLIKNPDTRAILQKAASDAAFRDAFAEQGFLRALARAEVRQAMLEAGLKSKMTEAEYEAALTSPAMRNAMTDDALRKGLHTPAMYEALSQSSLLAALRAPAFEAALKAPAFEAALKGQALEQALRTR